MPYPNTVPPGGTAEQALAKVDSVDYHTYWRDIFIPVDLQTVQDITFDLQPSTPTNIPNQLQSITTITPSA